MKVSVGNKTLIESCSFVATIEPIRIELSPTVIVQFEFENTEDKQTNLNLNVLDGVLVIHLQNFNNPLGTAPLQPIEIGTYHNQPLFIHFSAHAIGDGAKLITCSFWQG